MSTANPDPRLVLKHLNDLGYHNVTKENLKAFCHDLKQLINNDRKCMNDENAGKYIKLTLNKPMQQVSISTTDDTVSTVSPLRDICHNSLASNYNIQTKTDSSSSSRTNSYDTCDHQKTKKKTPSRGAPTVSSKISDATKPYSAFICPWTLTTKTTAPSNRCGPAHSKLTDPVALYHHYQSVWKKQKIPGSDNHGDLRWSIRQRMMGDEVHPRPVSQASSVDLRKRYKKR